MTTGNDDLCYTDLKCVEKLQCWPKPDCPVSHLATECELKNHEELLFCYTFTCYGEPPYSDCYSDCNRQSVEDLKNCPCYEKCPNGCAGCDHSICNSEEKCDTDQLTIQTGFSYKLIDSRFCIIQRKFFHFLYLNPDIGKAEMPRSS